MPQVVLRELDKNKNGYKIFFAKKKHGGVEIGISDGKSSYYVAEFDFDVQGEQDIIDYLKTSYEKTIIKNKP